MALKPASIKYPGVWTNELKNGDYILLIGFGGGLTWGGCLLIWGNP